LPTPRLVRHGSADALDAERTVERLHAALIEGMKDAKRL
jgi:hypothetical protein